jgi:hypothetical protein
MNAATRAELAGRYGELIAEMRSEFDEFRATGSLERARELTRLSGHPFDDARLPQFFTGELDSPTVLVHLNPKWDGEAATVGDWRLETQDFERYLEGSMMYGSVMGRIRPMQRLESGHECESQGYDATLSHLPSDGIRRTCKDC